MAFFASWLAALFLVQAQTATTPSPFPPRAVDLLQGGRYQVRPDGGVLAPDGQPVPASELPFLLTRLESSRRLKALLRIDLILSQSDGEKYLTSSEREQVRAIARANWPYFTLSLRKKFKAYFSLEELESLNQEPLPQGGESVMAMKDPEPLARAPDVEVVAVAAPIAAVVPAVMQPLRPPTLTAAPPPIQAPTIAPTVAPVVPPPVYAAAKNPPPVTAPVPVLPPPVQAGAETTPAIVSSATAAPPAAAPIAIAVSSAAASPPSVEAMPVQNAPQSLRDITQGEFEKFLMDAPYGREAKALLRLIAEKAPDFARSRALNAALSYLPLIVFDSEKAGADPGGSLIAQASPSGEKSYVIALSQGPVVLTRKRLFSSSTSLLPFESAYYAGLHAPTPAAQAIHRDAVATRQERGAWGDSRIFPDGSLRGTYSQFQQAGALLRLLLELDAAKEGWDASPYAVAVYGLDAQWLFYASARQEAKGDDFLDPATRSEFKRWLERPAEYHDDLAHALAGGLWRRLDPRKGGPAAQAEFDREASALCEKALAEDESARAEQDRQSVVLQLKALKEHGLVEGKALDETLEAAASAASPPAKTNCAEHWAGEIARLRQSALLLAQARTAERRFRTPPAEGTDAKR